MKLIAKTEDSPIAQVYIADLGEDRIVEFVESLEPPYPKEEKWVLIISTMLGCPVKCRFCDSGAYYKGKLTEKEMLSQIDFLISNSYPNRVVPVKKFKIQFARMGEPSLNNDVLEVLKNFNNHFDAPGFMPSVSTIAPVGAEKFLNNLIYIKNDIYKGRFQLQFSLHTTNEEQRNWLIPVNKLNFKDIAKYGDDYFMKGDRKITLNFALGNDMELNVNKLLDIFDPDKYFIKFTPINPTVSSQKNGLKTYYHNKIEDDKIIESVKNAGYDCMLSIGEIEENKIGSNCGQHILNYINSGSKLEQAYTYKLHKF